MKKLFEDDLLPMTEEHHIHILSKVLRKLVSYINKAEDILREKLNDLNKGAQ
jgi:hypothetical protein